MFKRFLPLVAIGVVVLMACGCAQRKMTRFEIDYMVLEADRLVVLADLDSAAILLNELALRNPRDTMLLLRQGLINRELQTVEGRRKSETALKRLVEMYPKNPQYHIELAKTLIAQSYEMQGRGELARAIELEPDDETPYLILADLYRRPYFLNDFEDRRDSAIVVLKALVGQKPNSLAGLVRLAEVYGVSGKLDSAEVFAQRAYWLDTLAVRTNLALGYIHYGKRNFDEAAANFAIALAGMTDRERDGFESLEYLVSPQHWPAVKQLSPARMDSLRTAFWFAADSDPTTRVNERQVEHYARVWQANLLFSDERGERAGWTTPMGETLIRLGWPDDRRRRLAEVTGGTAPAWWWYYTTTQYPCTLAFVDHMLSGSYSYPFAYSDNLGSARASESKRIAELIYRERPSEALVDRMAVPIPLSAVVYEFKRESATEVEIYAIAEIDSLARQTNGRAEAAEVRAVIHGRDGREVWRGDEQEAIIWGEQNREVMASGHFRAIIDPGRYRLATVVDQLEHQRFGVLTDTIAVRDFDGGHVAISSIVLARGAEGVPEVLKLRRETSLMPALNFEFLPHDTIRVYFEIYNLAKDLTGRTRYEVDYAMQFIKRSEGGIKGLMGKVFPGKKESITNTYREGGLSADVVRDVTLSARELRPGRYRLTVRITDLVIGGMAEQSSELVLREEGD